MCKFEKKLNVNNEILPTDKEGKCLFHSKDLKWKSEHPYSDYIGRLISIYELDENIDFIDLSGGIYDYNLQNAFQDRIDSAGSFNKKILLDQCEIYADFKIIGAAFEQAVDFSKSKFYENVSFKKSSFNGLSMNEALFFKDVFMTDVISKSYIISDNVDFKGGYVVNRCTFQNVVQFENCIFNSAPELNRSFSIMNSNFYGPVSFDGASFNKACIMNTITFYDRSTYLETKFDCQLSTPAFASVHFDNITIAESGNLLFKGKSGALIFGEAKDIYFHDLNVDGSVHFEYADLQKGTDSTVKAYLLKLAIDPEYDLTIGKGCVKYFNQTDIKTEIIDKSYRNLLIDVCNTFSKFFELKNNISIGLEIVQTTDEFIKYFYYSDQLIAKDEFLNIVDQSCREMWTVIEIKEQSIDSSDDQNIVAKGVDRVYDGIDVTVDLIAICIKLAARIPAIPFKNEICNKILNAHVTRGEKVIDYSKIETLNVNQTIFLGVGNEQNFNK